MPQKDLNPLPILRVARPTDNISQLLPFYVQGLGFNILAEFKNHAGFDGIIVGNEKYPYHFEFTHHHGSAAGYAPSKDHLLIFYLPQKEAYQQALDRMLTNGFTPVNSYNPYWDLTGTTFEDADGYRVVLQQGEWRP